jgi:hypothetical protein
MGEVRYLPFAHHQEKARWENVEGVVRLPQHEIKVIKADMCDLLSLNGSETTPEAVIIGERALQTTSSEAALGINVLSHVVSDVGLSSGDVSLGIHPAKDKVLYFFSFGETLSEEELSAESVKLMHVTDMVLKLTHSPFRILKDN